jgi:hypothetical protein
LAEDDPDVINDMQTAMAELKCGEEDNTGVSEHECTSDGSMSGNDFTDSEDGWEDDKDLGAASPPKRKKKWLLSVEKVRLIS